MAKELSFVLINPYTIRKSRTGGIISRVMARTGLELVSARMFGPSAELTEQYAQLLEQSPDLSPEERQIFADYVRRHYAPTPAPAGRTACCCCCWKVRTPSPRSGRPWVRCRLGRAVRRDAARDLRRFRDR
jgi:hypothetical protein